MSFVSGQRIFTSLLLSSYRSFLEPNRFKGRHTQEALRFLAELYDTGEGKEKALDYQRLILPAES